MVRQKLHNPYELCAVLGCSPPPPSPYTMRWTWPWGPQHWCVTPAPSSLSHAELAGSATDSARTRRQEESTNTYHVAGKQSLLGGYTTRHVPVSELVSRSWHCRPAAVHTQLGTCSLSCRHSQFQPKSEAMYRRTRSICKHRHLRNSCTNSSVRVRFKGADMHIPYNYQEVASTYKQTYIHVRAHVCTNTFS